MQGQVSCHTDISGAYKLWQPQFCQVPLALYKPVLTLQDHQGSTHFGVSQSAGWDGLLRLP